MSRKKHECDHLFMIVIIGDSAVGKSSLLKKFSEPEANLQATNQVHIATVGVDFVVNIIQVMNQRIKIQVWDTAGQERFRAVTTAYYRGAMGAVVCYDCTDRESLRNAERWLKDFEEKARPDAPKVLVACKKDKYRPEDHVPAQAGIDLANQFNCTFIESSAYTGQNVQAVFEQLSMQILKQRYKIAPTIEGKEGKKKLKAKDKGLRGSESSSPGRKRKKKCC